MGEKISMQKGGRGGIVSLKLQDSVLEMLASKWKKKNYPILEKWGN